MSADNQGLQIAARRDAVAGEGVAAQPTRTEEDEILAIRSNIGRSEKYKSTPLPSPTHNELSTASMPYHHHIRSLSLRMSHLYNLVEDYNHQQAGRIWATQVTSSGVQAELLPNIQQLDMLQRLVEKYKRLSHKDVTRVLFIVEDLYPGLLELVGQVFNFPHPEIFATHMLGARHQGIGTSAGEVSAKDWVTHGLEKPFFSIKWYRPVYRQAGKYGLDITKDILEVVATSAALPGEDTAAVDEEDEDEEEEPGNIEFIPISRFRGGGQKKRMRARTTTNIVRNNVMISSDPNTEQASTKAFLWEEKATVYISRHSDYTNVLVLLDPLPELLYTPKFSTKDENVLPYVAVRKQRHPPWPLPTTVDKPTWDSLGITNSTANDLLDAMHRKTKADPNQPMDDIGELLKIISQDIRDSVELMSATLEEITILSMDDSYLQENLAHWRMLINHMEKVVQTLIRDFHAFVIGLYAGVIPDDVRALSQDLQRHGDQLLEGVARCHAGLRADMSLLESRRGIAEAESVTRLTELAFIFIPLTFVAGLFSMQINELQPSVPVITFVKAAVIVTIITYSLRIIISTSTFKRIKRAIAAYARFKLDLGPNDTISFWGWVKIVPGLVTYGNGQMWAFWLILSAISLAVVPVALLWGQNKMDTSFKVVATLILIPTGLVFAWLLASLLTYKPAWSAKALLKKFVGWIERVYSRPRQQSITRTSGSSLDPADSAA